jgi:hypothetical protein
MKFGTTTYLHVTHLVFDFTAPIRLRFGISCSLRQEAQGPPLSTPFFISKDSCFLGMVLSFIVRQVQNLFCFKDQPKFPFLDPCFGREEGRCSEVVPDDPRLLNTMPD